jgi:hypothetical protein
MSDFAGYLKERYGPWVWMGQRASDAYGINRVLPLDMMVTCDFGREVSLFFDPVNVFSLEKGLGVRKDWSNEYLSEALRGPMGRKIFSRWDRAGRRVSVLCYRSVRKLEDPGKALSAGPRLFAVTAALKNRFDNKTFLYRELETLGLNRVPGRVERPGKSDYGQLKRELGLPFVVQFPYGSSGLHTFIIRSRPDYDNICREYPATEAVIREYVDGFSLNVNAVIADLNGRTETICCYPSVQITGLKECSNFESAFCGNDFSAVRGLDAGTIREVERNVKVTGAWMGRAGYRGIFGMDLVVRRGRVYPMEINPRFQNSTSLFNAIQALEKERRSSLFLLHIAQFLQREDARAAKYVRGFPFRKLMEPVSGCQVILHNRMRGSMVTGDLRPGVYARKSGGIVFLGGAADIGACKKANEYLITCGVPEKDMVIEANAPLCKIQARGPLIDRRGKRKLTTEAVFMVRDAYARLGLEREDHGKRRGMKAAARTGARV